MGLGSSQPSHEAGPKSFYLVLGNPPIAYLRDANRGPLIYNVELPATAAPEVIEQANTLKNYCCILGKESVKLTPAADTFRGMSGHCLTFTASVMKVAWKLDIFLDVQLEFKKGMGLQTSQISGATCPYHLFHQEYEAVEEAKQISFSCSAPIIVESLTNCDGNVPAGPRLAGTDQYSAPIVIRLSYVAPIETEERESVTEYFMLLSVPQFRTEQHATETLVCRPVKQYLQHDGDVYELNDVFDLAGEAVQEPGAEETQDTGDECVICLTNKKDTTIIPCRHFCLCAECAGLLRSEDNRCPICRSKVEKFLSRSEKEKK